MRHPGRRTVSAGRSAVVLVAVTVVAGCAVPAGAPPQATPARVALTEQHVEMQRAQRDGRDLGAVAGDLRVALRLGLAGRDQAGLDALMAAGTRLSPAQYAARFGPDPTAVAAARRVLASAGAQSAWQPGATFLAVSAQASAAESLFAVHLHNYRAPDGVTFYAPVPGSAATVPGQLAGTVTGVTGLDSYPHAHSSAIRAEHGVTPSDMLGFYDVTPLRSAGIDGSGQTIYFIELDSFSQAAFDAFSAKFSLPPQKITVVQHPEWGSPAKEEGEADLDVQVAHEIAPAARLVVYQASQPSFHTALAQIFSDHPGAIVSSSWGGCEADNQIDDSQQYKAMTDSAAAQGASIFVASGDRGAYDCTPDGNFNTVSADLDGGTPGVTSVGGTHVFLSSTSDAYYREAAWGEPVEQWGGSGGVSALWPIPSWQDAKGVQNQFSKGMRQTPDVSANADAQSGWEVFAPNDGPVGGTSAAAPFWAAVAALIDQALAAKQLKSVGFANPVLYYFARSPAGLPANPFHDVTIGNNLLYPATAGWDYATGLGTPDVAALTDDWLWYAQTHPNGGTS